MSKGSRPLVAESLLRPMNHLLAVSGSSSPREAADLRNLHVCLQNIARAKIGVGIRHVAALDADPTGRVP